MKNERNKRLANRRATIIIRRLFITLARVLNQAELEVLAHWLDAKAAGREAQPPAEILAKLEQWPAMVGAIKRAEKDMIEVKRRWG